MAPHKMVQAGEVFDMDLYAAKDSILTGVVAEQKMRQAPQNKMMAAPLNKSAPDAGKASAAGAGQPSSASQAAQALPLQTQPPSDAGEKRPTLKLRKKRAKRSQ